MHRFRLFLLSLLLGALASARPALSLTPDEGVASPGYERHARLGEVGVAFGPEVGAVVFDGLSARDEAALFRLSRTDAMHKGMASFAHVAANGWTFVRMVVGSNSSLRGSTKEFRAYRGGVEAVGYTMSTRDDETLRIWPIRGRALRGDDGLMARLVAEDRPDVRLHRRIYLDRFHAAADAERTMQVLRGPATEAGALAAVMRDWQRNHHRDEAPAFFEAGRRAVVDADAVLDGFLQEAVDLSRALPQADRRYVTDGEEWTVSFSPEGTLTGSEPSGRSATGTWSVRGTVICQRWVGSGDADCTSPEQLRLRFGM